MMLQNAENVYRSHTHTRLLVCMIIKSEANGSEENENKTTRKINNERRTKAT